MNDSTQPDVTSTTLGKVCEINPPRPRLAAMSDDAAVLFVPMAAVDDVTGTITTPEQRRIADVRNKSYRTFAPGDVLFAKITPCMENGKAAVVPEDTSEVGFGSTEFHVLRPKFGVNSQFIWHFVRQKSFRRTAEEQMTGSVGQARVPSGFLDSFPIELPNEDRQEQIVEALNKSIDLASSATMHLGSARAAIERLRQSVLAAACSGSLTADWRESSRERASVESLLEDIDALKGAVHHFPAPDWNSEIPDTWALVSLDRLTTTITSGSRGWAKHYATDGPLFIRAQNINCDLLDLEDVAHVRPPKGSEGERTEVQNGDLLVTITGANVTKAAFVDREIGEAYVNQHVALARPVRPGLAEYLHLWTISPEHGRKKLSSDAYGAGRPGLNLDNLRTMPVGLPPLDEQVEIVKRARALLALADRVNARLDVASRCIDRGSQAILAKAFRGELSV